MGEDGSPTLAVLSAILFLGGLFLETRVLFRWRANWYFTVGLPLGARPVPISAPPRGEGRTASVRWEVASPTMVRYWADPNERAAPSGMHGVVFLTPSRKGVELDVRWAPPWTPLLAAVWLAGLGIAREEVQLTLPIAASVVLGIFILYGSRARQVAAELRWAFVRGDDVPPPDLHG